jgi:hypothetical protein
MIFFPPCHGLMTRAPFFLTQTNCSISSQKHKRAKKVLRMKLRKTLGGGGVFKPNLVKLVVPGVPEIVAFIDKNIEPLIF